MRVRAISAGLVVSMALAAGACGGKGGGGSAAKGAGADVVPAGVPAFVSVNTDLGSGQWKNLKALINKFPDHAQVNALLNSSLSRQGLSYDKDIKPALGKEIDIVSLSTPSGTIGTSGVVALVNPADEGKFKAFIDKTNKSGSKAYTAKVGGWWAISSSQSTLDSFKSKASGKKLSGDSNFKDAMSQVSGDAFVTAYVSGQALAGAFGSSTASAGGSVPFGLDKLQYIVVRGKAQGDGLQIEGAVKGEGAPGTGATPFTSKLISGVPEGALAFADFRGGTTVDTQIQSLQGLPQFHKSVQQFETALGVKLADVLSLIRNEVAIYVRPGSPLPELTIALEEPNVQQALTTLNTIAARVAARTHGQLTTGSEGGVTTKTIRLRSVAVTYAGFDGRVLITTGASGIRDYRAGGGKLSGDAVYKDATSSAGVPGQTSGLLYVNLKDGIPLIENLVTASNRNLPPIVQRNLAPLRSFVVYGTGKTGLSKFTAFLQIK